MLVVGPANFPINGGTSVAGVSVWTGPLVAGEVVTATYVSAVPDAGVTRTDFDIDIFPVSTGIPIALGSPLYATANFTASFTIVTPDTYTLIILGGGAPPDSSHGQLLGFTFDVSNAAGFCQYGSRLQSGQQEVIIISGAVISAAAFLVPELVLFNAIWDAFAGFTVVPGVFCASPQPTMPTFTDADYLFGTRIPSPGSLAKFWDALQVALWQLYCECTPGTGGAPPPVKPPLPLPNLPSPGAPQPLPPVLCDSGDICTSLNQISRMLVSLTAQLTYTRNDIQLIQRQAVPFGYLRGTIHPSLSGSGSFAVQGILGLRVQLDTVPSTWGMSSDNPPRFMPAPASVTMASADGTTNTYWINDADQVELNAEAGVVTLVTYHCKPGVSIAITELNREP